MNATETIILECNNAESVKAQNEGLPSFTKIDKSTWSNNFQSIEIKRGDSLTMEYAIINQLGGGQGEAIEFSDPTEPVPDRDYNGNSVIFELEFYVNHNGINTVGLPFAGDGNFTNIMGGNTGNQTVLNTPAYPTHIDTDASAIADYRTSNRLLMTDCKKYTLLHPRFNTIIGTDPLYLRTDKRYVQYQQDKNFISADNLANELTIKLHETNTNPPKHHASDLTTELTLNELYDDYALGIIRPFSFVDFATGPDRLYLGGFLTLNKNTYISRSCNLKNTIINEDGSFSMEDSNIYDQMAVLNPYKWIDGTKFNLTTTYDLQGDTSYNTTPTAQIYPRVIARYNIDVAPNQVNFLPFSGTVGAEDRTYMPENMAVFTNIEATTDNLDKIKEYFESICKYYGTALDESDARQDKDNWSCILDIGRTSQEGQSGVTDNGTPIGATDLGLTGTFICPTTSRKANNEDIDPTVDDTEEFYLGGIGVKPFFKDILVDFNSVVNTMTNPAGITFSLDDTYIQFSPNQLVSESVIYNYAKENNIGAYPYFYDDELGDRNICLCFLVSKTAINHMPAPLTIGNYIGFSPSFYDNSAVLMINKDISTPKINGIDNQNPYLNVGASDIQVSYSSALSAFGFGQLHTSRRKGWKDDTGTTDGLGQEIVVINEQLDPAGGHNINSVNCRSSQRLNRDGNASATFNFVNQNNDVNTGYSDSIAGVFIKEVYFGKPTFNPNQYRSRDILADPSILNRIAVKASQDNWYGSLLWKMGGEYIDFYSQFTNLSRGLRFNNAFWRNLSQIRSVAPLTTNSNIDCSTAPFMNVGGAPSAGAGLGNYGLGYDNLEQVNLGGITTAIMYFTGEIKRSETGFYRIYTDFCSPTYLDGAGGKLNVIGMALKSYSANDFFYSYSPSYQIIADRDYILSNITTSIRNSDGTLANVGDRCVIVYKITKPKLILQPTPETKQSQENDLEEIVEELEELNTTTSLNNMLLRGGVKPPVTGASRGGGGASGGQAISRRREPLRQNRISLVNGERRIGVDPEARFMGEGRRLDEAEEEKQEEQVVEELVEEIRGDIFENRIDFEGMKKDLTEQLILNVLDRVPSLELINREGQFDYGGYIQLAQNALSEVYYRFLALFDRQAGQMNAILNDTNISQEQRRRALVEVAQTLAEAVEGIDINPNGRAYLSVPPDVRNPNVVLGTDITPEGLQLIIDNLNSRVSRNEIGNILNSLIQSGNMNVMDRNIPIVGEDDYLFDDGAVASKIPDRSNNIRNQSREDKEFVEELIQGAKFYTGGDKEEMVEWFRKEIRHLAGADVTGRQERLENERVIRLMNDALYIVETGERIPQPVDRADLDRSLSMSSGGSDDNEYIAYDPVTNVDIPPMPEYAVAPATRQLQEVDMTQPPEDTQTFQEERPPE